MAIIRSTNSPYELAIDNNLGARVNLYDAAGSALASTGGALNVNVSGGAIDVGTTDGASFVYGASAQQPIGGVFQDTSPGVTAGESGALRMTSQRGLHTNLRNSSGNELLGQMTSALSLPVVIASDQSAVPATQSGTWNINNISGTISLPTGASTDATVSALSAKFNSLGQKASAASAPVVLASDQSAIPVSQSGTWTVEQGSTPTTVANAWPFKLTDGTNTTAVKAASTAAVAADPSAVIAFSPNSSLPTGMNTIGATASESSTGSAVPSKATYSAGINAGNLVGMAVDASGNTEVVGNVASGSNDSGSPVKVGSVYNSSLPTPSSGQRVDLQANEFGELAVASRNKYKRISGAGTTTVKSGTGRLHTVTWGAGGAGFSITIYDNTTNSGTIIAVFNNTGGGAVGGVLIDAEFSTGLTIVTVGGGQECSVTYQ